MEWFDCLVTVTGWSAEPGELDWSGTERALGTPLPTDFKELRRRFAAWAAFSDHVLVLEAQGDTESVLANHESFAQVRVGKLRRSVDVRTVWAPRSE
ncbi:hypothetical protein ABCR94_36450 [Streptomyces sp. 21So2-11]|uniref:hypothetical protein n=1 Tax=Streptomyces sp. 21So2-11 TaxID=3144408 RepID=UPI00321A0E1D